MGQDRISKEQHDYLAPLYPESGRMKNSKSLGEEIQKGFLSITFWEGQILNFLSQIIAPKKILEIGTFTGYSIQWLAKSVAPDTKIYTIESDSEHHARATKALNGFSGIQCLKGPAVEVLNDLKPKAPFDLIFIDANKNAYVEYLDWSTQHISKGGMIIADNVFLGGAVYQPGLETQYSPKQVETMRVFNKKITENPDFVSVILPTFEGLLAAYRKT